MNWLIYHIAGGQAFFSGVALVIVAAWASARSDRLAKHVTICGFLLGAAAIAMASAAIPYWWYGIAVVVTTAWVIARLQRDGGAWRRWTPFAMIGVWAVAAAIEAPYHIMPTLVPAPSRSLAVIGDSVTAGMGGSDKSVRWPILLAQQHHVEVQDISHAGATAASALEQAKAQPIASPVVVLEIGGNDLLGSTSAAQFSSDLDALLAYVSAPGRQVVMLELPLPPFRHEYGRIQRSLARKHHVLLVPKRVFMSVLTADGATVDTIHLSQAGHQRVAACVWQVVRSAFAASESE
jgi:acyl-CoA thioesterase I